MLPAVCFGPGELFSGCVPSCGSLHRSVYEPQSKLSVGEGLPLGAVPEIERRGRGAHAPNWVSCHLGVQGTAATAGTPPLPAPPELHAPGRQNDRDRRELQHSHARNTGVLPSEILHFPNGVPSQPPVHRAVPRQHRNI